MTGGVDMSHSRGGGGRGTFWECRAATALQCYFHLSVSVGMATVVLMS